MQHEWIKTRGSLNESHATASEEPFPMVFDLETINVPQTVVRLVPESVAREHIVLPLRVAGETLFIACSDPNAIATADRLRFITAKDVHMVQANPSAIVAAINRHYGVTETEPVASMICEFNETAIDIDDDDFAAACLEHVPARMAKGPGGASNWNRFSIDESTGRRIDDETLRFEAIRHREQTSSSSGGRGMFHYTIDEGQRVLVTSRSGNSEILVGPQRVWSWGKRFEDMSSFTAHPGEYLAIRFRDGRQEHLPGPAEVLFDRRTHHSIKVHEALQIDANEAIVVYIRTDDSDEAARRIERGPQMFVPAPSEWLHTFKWHASKGGSQGAPKVAKSLVFQKLWLMPDQMYHDVPDVRTSDDAVLTIRLMIFFEMTDLEKMLDATHDPIGDFVNAATADVVEFTGQYDFDSFKQHTHQLNELSTYEHLLGRAAQVGYRINNVVYRGYGAPVSLQQMHDQAIEARTRLQLERATEEQAQQLEDFKLDSQLNRATRRRSEQTEEVQHDLELNSQRQNAELQRRQAEEDLNRKIQEQNSISCAEAKTRDDEIQQQHLRVIGALGVDLTQYLTHSRADKVIEVRGENTSPHLHLD